MPQIRPSDGCGLDAVLMAVERWYDFPEFSGYLENVGLSASWFLSLEDARSKFEAWRHEDNEVRPHSSIDHRIPIEQVRASMQ